MRRHYRNHGNVSPTIPYPQSTPAIVTTFHRSQSFSTSPTASLHCRWTDDEHDEEVDSESDDESHGQSGFSPNGQRASSASFSLRPPPAFAMRQNYNNAYTSSPAVRKWNVVEKCVSTDIVCFGWLDICGLLPIVFSSVACNWSTAYDSSIESKKFQRYSPLIDASVT